MTLPEDENIFALRVARHLAQNMETAGIQVNVVPTRHATFLREVLINRDYDLYVWRLPEQSDPDFLRPLLHSRFAEEPGWQNPFGYSNTIVDDLLDAQVQYGENRGGELVEIQELLAQEWPFIPIGFEEEQRLVRSDRITPDTGVPFSSPLWVYRLDPEDSTVQLGTNDWRLSQNLNPIAVEYRGQAGITDLLYGSPIEVFDGDYIPWLASTWEWVSPRNARLPTLEFQLREGLTWEDGEPIDGEDVIFTYDFLSDTSMQDEDPQVPAPVYRRLMTLLDSAEAVDDRQIRLQFKETARSIARDFLTIPILPQHIWEELTEFTEVAGITVSEVTTDALVEDNLDPVGSGPYRVTNVETDSRLTLERIDDHPFVAPDGPGHPLPDVGVPEVEEIEIDIRLSVSSIVESIREGGLDGSLCGIGRSLAADGSETDGVEVYTQETSRLFHVGFNTRSGSLSHSGFRGAVERLIDRHYLEDIVFQNGIELTHSPLYDESYVPEDLTWSTASGRRFAGEPGSGEVDPERARNIFRDAGFSYSGDGELLTN